MVPPHLIPPSSSPRQDLPIHAQKHRGTHKLSPWRGGPGPLPSPGAGPGGRTKPKPQDRTKHNKMGGSHASPGQRRGNAASESHSWSLPSSIFVRTQEEKKHKAAKPCPSHPRPGYWLAQAQSRTSSCLRDVPWCDPARVARGEHPHPRVCTSSIENLQGSST